MLNTVSESKPFYRPTVTHTYTRTKTYTHEHAKRVHYTFRKQLLILKQGPDNNG